MFMIRSYSHILNTIAYRLGCEAVGPTPIGIPTRCRYRSIVSDHSPLTCRSNANLEASILTILLLADAAYYLATEGAAKLLASTSPMNHIIVHRWVSWHSGVHVSTLAVVMARVACCSKFEAHISMQLLFMSKPDVLQVIEAIAE